MSKVQLQGNVSGTGVFTIASPNSNTDRTLTLPDNTGTLLTSGSAIQRSQLPTGSVLQVVSATKTDVFTTTTTSWVDITGLSVNITPTSASNKILLIVSIQMYNATTGQGFYFRLMRNSTPIGVGDASGSRPGATNMDQAVNAGRNTTPMNANFLDSPATTSSTTYKCQTAALDVGTIVVNRSSSDSDNASYARTISTITAMEIAA